ncbi:MAG: hypothetical protein QGE95_15385 [Arenicellales bacterium]|nr:hypothetical protein [Arenicellales bacterium]
MPPFLAAFAGLALLAAPDGAGRFVPRAGAGAGAGGGGAMGRDGAGAGEGAFELLLAAPPFRASV